MHLTRRIEIETQGCERIISAIQGVTCTPALKTSCKLGPIYDVISYDFINRAPKKSFAPLILPAALHAVPKMLNCKRGLKSRFRSENFPTSDATLHYRHTLLTPPGMKFVDSS